MRFLPAITVLLLLLAAPALAQDSDTGARQREGKVSVEERLARMQKFLDLSDEQVAELREIRQRGGSREEVRAVFTDEQWAQLQERRRQANARRGQENAGRYYSLPSDTTTEEPDG